MNTVSKYLSLVKFAHTIFAMPFAAVGFVYAYATLPAGAVSYTHLTLPTNREV